MKMREKVYEAYRRHIEENFEENKKASAIMKDLVEHSPLCRNGVLDKTLMIPKILDDEIIDDFKRIGATAYRIFGKVIEEYRRDAGLRELFPFSKELENLILLPRQYDGLLPIARFDLFYNEETKDFYFCEINTDGTAAMIRDLELGKAYIRNPAHQSVIRQFGLRQFELFDSYLSEFLSLYDTYPKKKDNPNIAIVDFLENATPGDFEEFARRFQKKGYNCEICDIRSLTYHDGTLYSGSGNRIDAVYRRAVTADIMSNYAEAVPFLNAVRDDAVFMAGAFETQILHTKWIFSVLHSEKVKALLTEEENAFVAKHVPATYLFAAGNIELEEVRKNKNNYMIKPMDAYASNGVYAAGREYSQEQWDSLVGELYGKGYVCQQFCPQYETDNIDFAWGDGKMQPYINMPGLYMYNGKFSGVLMRLAPKGQIIVAHENERTVPVYYL